MKKLFSIFSLLFVLVTAGCTPDFVLDVADLPKEITINRNILESTIIAGSEEFLFTHISDGEEEKAKQARQRILRFFDEICAGQEHSESHFEDILDDIDFYETYCSEHPKFKNSRGATAMEQIRDTYKHLKAKGGFLTYKR